jgi:hypothetical protein
MGARNHLYAHFISSFLALPASSRGSSFGWSAFINAQSLVNLVDLHCGGRMDRMIGGNELSITSGGDEFGITSGGDLLGIAVGDELGIAASWPWRVAGTSFASIASGGEELGTPIGGGELGSKEWRELPGPQATSM